MDYGKLEVFSKEEVFNPYKYCGGKGYEYEKLAEMDMNKKMWDVLKRYIWCLDYEINGKKVDTFSDPYYRRTEFIGDSDVPVNGHYE